jgi:hypothetical protein
MARPRRALLLVAVLALVACGEAEIAPRQAPPAPSVEVSEHDAGRHFHVLVAFGPRTPAEIQQQAWAILDGLRVDLALAPDWKSSG